MSILLPMEVKSDLMWLPNTPSSLQSLIRALHRCIDTKQPTRSPITGHTDYVCALVALPNGLIASASDDTTIKIWDVHTGKCQHTLIGHTASVNALIALANGRIASGSTDHTIKIWDVSGKCVRTLNGHKLCINALAVLPNGHLASGSDDGTIRIWDTSNGKCISTFEEHVGAVYVLVVLPNGCLVSGSWDDIVRFWDMSTGACIHTLKGHNGSVYSLAVLPNGRIASASTDKTVKVWDVSTRKCVCTLKGHTSYVRAVVLLPNGRLASTGNDKTIRIWDVSTRKCVRILKKGILKAGHTNVINALVVLVSGRLASGSEDKTIRLWDMPASQLPAKGQRSAQLIRALKSFATTHPNADPFAVALQANIPSVTNYLSAHGFLRPIASISKAVHLWNNTDVLQWLSCVNIGNHRSQYTTALTQGEATGEDLVEAALKGKEEFVAEMKEDFGINRRIARRMFNSLRALRLRNPILGSKDVNTLRDISGITITSSTPEEKRICSYTNSVAVLIGIDKYEDQSVTNLYACERDVNLMKETIAHNFCGVKHKEKGPCKHCDAHILTLVNEEATSNNIVRKIVKFFSSLKRGKRDRLLFFFAGHGCIEQDEWHLLSYDHIPANVVTGVSMSKLVKIAKSHKFHHILFVLDSCHAGKATWCRTGAVRSLKSYLQHSSVQVLAATRSTAKAREMHDSKSMDTYGLLTAAFTKALTSNALKKRTWMPIDVLFTMIRAEVIRTSTEQQIPLLRHLKDNEGEFVVWAPRKYPK